MHGGDYAAMRPQSVSVWAACECGGARTASLARMLRCRCASYASPRVCCLGIEIFGVCSSEGGDRAQREDAGVFHDEFF